MTHDTRKPTQPPIPGDAPGNDGPPISPLVPGSMHRAEQDAEAFATSPEFHERPAEDTHTAPTASNQPPRSSKDGRSAPKP